MYIRKHPSALWGNFAADEPWCSIVGTKHSNQSAIIMQTNRIREKKKQKTNSIIYTPKKKNKKKWKN